MIQVLNEDDLSVLKPPQSFRRLPGLRLPGSRGILSLKKGRGEAVGGGGSGESRQGSGVWWAER